MLHFVTNTANCGFFSMFYLVLIWRFEETQTNTTSSILLQHQKYSETLIYVFLILACKKWDVLGNKIGGKHSERSENSCGTASSVFFASQTNYQALFTQTQGKLSFIQNLGSNFLTWGTESFLLVTFIFLQAFNFILCRVLTPELMLYLQYYITFGQISLSVRVCVCGFDCNGK